MRSRVDPVRDVRQMITEAPQLSHVCPVDPLLPGSLLGRALLLQVLLYLDAAYSLAVPCKASAGRALQLLTPLVGHSKHALKTQKHTSAEVGQERCCLHVSPGLGALPLCVCGGRLECTCQKKVSPCPVSL